MATRCDFPCTHDELKDVVDAIFGHKKLPDPINVTVKAYVAAICKEDRQLGVRSGIGICWQFDSGNVGLTTTLPGPQTQQKAELRVVLRAINDAKFLNEHTMFVYTQSDFLMTVGTMWLPIWFAQRDVVLSESQQSDADKMAEFVELYNACLGMDIHWSRVSSGDECAIDANTLAERGMMGCSWYKSV